MNELGKKVNKILTICLGIALLAAIVLMIVALALEDSKIKVIAIIITIIVCVVAFASEFILKLVFKETDDNKSKDKETKAE